jgi:putative pyruvate formate lyase activating enzyme
MKADLSMLSPCVVCPRRCGVDRLAGERGFCGAGKDILVAHSGPHFGEEPPITGTKGSGNIFFSFCNLRCLFCQNYQISHEGQGSPVTLGGLVEMFFSLEAMGCHNINLVSPTPYVPFIAAAIGEAKERGIGIPFVYNANGYDSVDALRSLDGLIDIYLPDFKYWSPAIAQKLSSAAQKAPYPECARAAIIEMKRQVGDLVVESGVAKRGILVRHLVLPGGLAGSCPVLTWIAENLGRQTSIGLMSQYLPLHRSGEYPLLSRKIRQEEYDDIVSFLINNGMENVFIQELESAPLLVPDFGREHPFGEWGGGAHR